jgi:hypothetical protein
MGRQVKIDAPVGQSSFSMSVEPLPPTYRLLGYLAHRGEDGKDTSVETPVVRLDLPLRPDDEDEDSPALSPAVRAALDLPVKLPPHAVGADPRHGYYAVKTMQLMHASLVDPANTRLPRVFACVAPGCDQRFTRDQASERITDALAYVTLAHKQAKAGASPVAGEPDLVAGRLVFLTCGKAECTQHAEAKCKDLRDEQSKTREVQWLCAQCHKTVRASTIPRCGQCHRVAYCNKQCQAAHWQEHRIVCKKPTKKPDKTT